MITRLSNSLLLQPCDINPSQDGWEVVGVFNPAVTIVGDDLFMLARVAERPTEKRFGWIGLPRWTDDSQAAVDWVGDEDVHRTDARVVSVKSRGDLRLTSVSHFQIFRQSRSTDLTWQFVDALLPEGSWEEYGIEDARITKIDETYWISYVAVSRAGAATALLSTKDFVKFQRHGIIFPSENKDVVLFPARIAGDYVALHRPNPRSHFRPPQIWIARSPDLIHWGRHQPLVAGVQSWEGDRVGSGTPPVLLDEGWLTLYHGSETSRVDGIVGRYSAGALLLDREDPTRVIARSHEPIMQPTTKYETVGFVPNVVFPTGAVADANKLLVYYGAADAVTGLAEFSLSELLDSMTISSH